MDASFVFGISAVLGSILSFFYEKFFEGWKWKGKFWVFTGMCIVLGGLIAIGNKEIAFTPLMFDSASSIFASLGLILKWAGALLSAGQAYHFLITKRN
jgi:hypothetical protein